MIVNSSAAELEAGWVSQSPGPRGAGRLALLVLRASPADLLEGQDKIAHPLHHQPDSIRFTAEHGIDGDRWKAGKEVGSQISLTSLVVTKLVAGPRERWHLLGDNLVVDLDLSADALPVGSRLKIGTGLVELSAIPHAPCDRYAARLGQAAHDWVADEKHASRHLRGRYARVLRGGEVCLESTIALVNS